MRGKKSSCTIEWKTPTGQRKEKELFINYEKQPIIVERQVTLVRDQSRAERRPSKMARKQGVRVGMKLLKADGIDFGDWRGKEQMPDEFKEEDLGWKPGPIPGKAALKFKGPKPGPVGFDDDASATEIIQKLLSDEMLQVVCELAAEHSKLYREERGLATKKALRKDDVERSVNPKKLTPAHVRIWLAVKMRGAQLARDVPINDLFDVRSEHYDPQVHYMITKKQYWWWCRHASFGDINPNAPKWGEEGYDRYQKKAAKVHGPRQ